MASRYDQYVQAPAAPPPVDMGNYGKSRYDQYVSPPAPAGYNGPLPPSPYELQQQIPGVLDRIGGDLSTRWNQAKQDAANYPAMAPVIGLGVATGSANDVANQLMGAAIPDSIKQGLSSGAQKAGSAIDATNIGQAIGDKLLATKTAYENFIQSNPKTAISLRTAGNVASFIPTERVAESAISAAPAMANAVSNAVPTLSGIESASQKLPGILGDVSSGVEKPITFSPEALQTGAKIRYDNAANMGGLIKPEGFADTVAAIKQKVGYQTPEGIAFAGENPVTDTLNRLDTIKGQPVSLNGLDEIDGRLSSDISKAMRAGDNESASKLLEIKGMLKNASNTVKPADLVNPQAFDEWRAGDSLWTAKSKMQQLQGIVDNAYNTDNPDTAMRTGYKNLAKQLNKNPMGWTPEEISQVQAGARRGLTAGALKIVGSRLMSGIIGTAAGASGGPAGAIMGGLTGEALGYPMRAAANAMQESRAMAPFTSVANRPAVIAALPQSVAEIAKLPMPQQKAAFDALLKNKNAIQLNNRP